MAFDSVYCRRNSSRADGIAVQLSTTVNNWKEELVIVKADQSSQMTSMARLGALHAESTLECEAIPRQREERTDK